MHTSLHLRILGFLQLSLAVVVACLLFTSSTHAQNWMFKQAEFTHQPQTGERVTQYEALPSVEALADRRAIRSVYSRSRTVLRGLDGSNDAYYQVNSYGNGKGGMDAQWERYQDAWQTTFFPYSNRFGYENSYRRSRDYGWRDFGHSGFPGGGHPGHGGGGGHPGGGGMGGHPGGGGSGGMGGHPGGGGPGGMGGHPGHGGGSGGPGFGGPGGHGGFGGYGGYRGGFGYGGYRHRGFYPYAGYGFYPPYNGGFYPYPGFGGWPYFGGNPIFSDLQYGSPYIYGSPFGAASPYASEMGYPDAALEYAPGPYVIPPVAPTKTEDASEESLSKKEATKKTTP